MNCSHLQSIWNDHAGEHKEHSAEHGRLVSVHHGHRHPDGTVTMHDEPYQMVRCKCGELVKLPFFEAA